MSTVSRTHSAAAASTAEPLMSAEEEAFAIKQCEAHTRRLTTWLGSQGGKDVIVCDNDKHASAAREAYVNITIAAGKRWNFSFNIFNNELHMELTQSGIAEAKAIAAEFKTGGTTMRQQPSAASSAAQAARPTQVPGTRARS